jgi:hypothetical protein
MQILEDKKNTKKLIFCFIEQLLPAYDELDGLELLSSQLQHIFVCLDGRHQFPHG